jgi:hypothetical protein
MIGFLYSNKTGEVAGPHVKPGSALAHMGGEVQWRQFRRVEDVPARLLRIMAARGMGFQGGVK